jgi:hypothetical protein
MNENNMRHHPHPQRAHRSSVTVCLVASASCIMYFEGALAQDPAPRVTIDASRCIELASPEERLACFDAQVTSASSGQRSESASPAPVAAGVPPAVQQQSAPTVAVARVPPQNTAADAPANEWVGTITSLKVRAPNQYLITLDSGQVWSQPVAARYALRIGQRVRVYESRWGSSKRLEADGVKGFIQVELVR